MSTRYSNEAFKWNIVKYASGRAANAILSIAIFLWIARVMPGGQYAMYIAACSVLELMLVVSGLGMEWVTGCLVPIARIKASGRALHILVYRCTAIQVAGLAAGAVLFWAVSARLSAALDIGDATAALQVYAIVMLVEGVNRLIRDQLLSALLLQGPAQVSQLCRNLAIAGLAAFAFRSPELRSAEVLGMLECLASGASLAVGALFLLRDLKQCRAKAQPTPWESPGWAALLKTGRDAWIGNLANLTWGPQVVILLVARSAGAEATALLGFARNLSEYVRRYMPMEFLAGVFRAFVVVRYAADKSGVRMAAMLGLAYKINLLFLLPFLAVAIVDGDDLFAAIGHPDYRGARWLVVGWLLITVAWAHRRISDLLAHTLGMSFVPRSAGLRLAGTPVLIYLCSLFFGLYSFFLVLFLAEAAYCAFVVKSVNRLLPTYRFDWPGIRKFGVALAAAIGALQITHFGSSALYLACNWLLAASVGYGVIFLLHAWTDDEAALVGRARARRPGKVLV
jgi:hypothetical protein